MLGVGGGAILDLNGHTLRCKLGSFTFSGINMDAATLRNGTITGCQRAVVMDSHGVIKGVTLSGNSTGVFIREFGHHNLVSGNLAIHNQTGFSVDDQAHDNQLVDNRAIENSVGFSGGGPGAENDILIGNVARGNTSSGFSIAEGMGYSVVGNRAQQNGVGFVIQDNTNVKVVGNIATGNREQGFILESNALLHAAHNVARRNGGDGFRIGILSQLPGGNPQNQTLTNNYAIWNGGNGIRVLVDAPPLTIRGNTALGQRAPHFDLADDNSTCQGHIWRNNTFGTKSQGCIR